MAKSFWSIENNALVWRVADGEPHTDDIEMSGLRCDCIVSSVSYTHLTLPTIA